MIEFSISSEIDPIAVLAVIISLASLSFSALQFFKNMHRVRVSVIGDMIVVPDDGLGKRLSVNIVNCGDTTFSIISLSFSNGSYFHSRQLIPTNIISELPKQIGPGQIVSFFPYQDKMLDVIGKNYMKCHVQFSFQKKARCYSVTFATDGK